MDIVPTSPLRGHIEAIDTLRAIAVLLVVAFHAAPNAMPGGFIGVDIFFVLSGYVIARRYLFALLSGRETLASFFAARFRRLLPAAALVMLVTTIAMSILAKPEALHNFSQTLMAQPFYVQNFVFWYQGDYFESPLQKPLLHTWSLAVEEQFYIAFAIAILAAGRWPRLLLVLLIGGALVSIVAGLLLVDRSPKTAFFMLPTRAWQFAFGIGAYIVAQRLTDADRPLPFASALAVLGTLGCLLSGLMWTEAASFPSSHAAWASLCVVAALLGFEFQGAPAALRLRSVRYVGTVSYGFYLWHWPPLAIYYVATGGAPRVPFAICLMIVAFAAASASYHLIERPIRTRRLLRSPRQGAIGVIAVGAGAVGAATVMIATNGAMFRYPSEIRPYLTASMERTTFRCGIVYRLQNPASEMCPLNTVGKDAPGILLLGDSHADVMDDMLATVAVEAGVRLYLTVRNCDFGRYGEYTFCSSSVLDRVLAEARANDIGTIVSISFWNAESIPQPERLSENLRRANGSGQRLIVMETVPEDPSYDPELRALAALEGEPLRRDGIRRSEYLARLQPFRAVFRGDAVAGRMDIVELVDIFCGSKTCTYEIDGHPAYTDSNHLSLVGRELVRNLFVNLFEHVRKDGGAR